MRILYWIVVVGALLLSGASAWLFFGDLNKDEKSQAQAVFEQRIEALNPDAEAGRSGAQYRLAQTYRQVDDPELQDFSLARYWYKKAAEQGHLDAQYELAMLYKNGLGVPQSYHRAAEWLRLAAGLGRHKEAQFELGELYFRGRGVAHDYGQAVSWYQKAAGRGHPISQYLLGVMFSEGWGVESDDQEAYKWLTLAAPHRDAILAFDKNSDVRAAREKLLQRMNRSQIDAAKKRVQSWKPQQ